MSRRLLTVAVLTAGAVAAIGSAGAAAPGSRIVFAANRVGLFNGEVYRVDPDGTRVDLSNSPALDLYPAVSPDGKHVVFVSTRGGVAAVYVVGTDGKALRRVSPPLFRSSPADTPFASFAWAPDSRAFAAMVNGEGGPSETGVYAGDVQGGWRRVGRNGTTFAGADASLAVSPDGRAVAYDSQAKAGSVQVVSSAGKQLWTVVPGLGTPAWSASGRLAVSTNTNTLRVYDGQGHTLAGYPGDAFAWSPNGSVLAVMDGKRLQLRHGGVGKPFLDVWLAKATITVPGNGPDGVQWIGSQRLRIYGRSGWFGYDVVRRRAWALPGAAAMFAGVVSPDGASAAQLGGRGGSAGLAALTLFRPGSRAGTVLQTADWCGGDNLPFGSLQFVPHTASLVYQSSCYDPNADLYAIDPDGSHLFRITDTPTDERQPSLSPDGTTVAYVQADGSDENCQGCPESLWRVPVSGGPPQQLTAHTDQDQAPFDDDPSWSPAGQQLLFVRAGLETPRPTLTTIPATGGAVDSLGLTGEPAAWGPERIGFRADLARLTIKTLDPQTHDTRTVATGGNVDIGGLAWSTDGRLAYLVYDAGGGASIVTIGAPAKTIDLVALLPHGSTVSGLAWSPDGSRFAFVATDSNGVGEVYSIDATGHNLVELTHDIGAVAGGLSWR